MGIYPAADQLVYKTNGATLDTNLSIAEGDHTVVVQEWDNCGGSSATQVNLNVGSSGSGSGTPAGAKLSATSMPQAAGLATLCCRRTILFAATVSPADRRQPGRGRPA